MDNCWIDPNGKCLYVPPEGYYGFVYCVTHIPSGKIYIGKKAFLYKAKRKISKKTIKETKTRKRIERVEKDSKWLSYWGSSRELLNDLEEKGIHNFKREILCYCSDKASLSYWEAYYQMQYNVMFVDSYNGWIKLTVYKKTLNK